MIDDKNPRRINPKGIGLIYIYILSSNISFIYIHTYIYRHTRLSTISLIQRHYNARNIVLARFRSPKPKQ